MLCVDLLLKVGANQDIQDDDGLTALSFATRIDSQACIKLLQQAGAASADAAMSSLLNDLEKEKAGKTKKKKKKKKHKIKKTSSSSLPDQGHGFGG